MGQCLVFYVLVFLPPFFFVCFLFVFLESKYTVAKEASLVAGAVLVVLLAVAALLYK